MIAPTPARMGVYRGTERIGEVEDHGKRCVRAFRGTGQRAFRWACLPIGKRPWSP